MADQEDSNPDRSVFETHWMADIKKMPDILSGLKLNVTPRMVMEPRFHSRPEDREKLAEISGYMVYVESQSEPPALMVMRVGKGDVTATMGTIEGIPEELIRRAIENPVEKPSNGMYAITDEIREWLKKELGL
jgi:hypothetical protein